MMVMRLLMSFIVVWFHWFVSFHEKLQVSDRRSARGPQVSGPPRTPGREGREEREEGERGLSVRRLSAAVSPPAAHQLTDPMMAGDRSTEGAQIRAAESGKVQLVEPGVGAEFRWCCGTPPLCVRPGYGFCCRVRCESTQCGSTP